MPLWQPISNTLSPSLEVSRSLSQSLSPSRSLSQWKRAGSLVSAAVPLCRCAALSSTPYLQSPTPSLLRQHTSAHVSIRDVCCGVSLPREHVCCGVSLPCLLAALSRCLLAFSCIVTIQQYNTFYSINSNAIGHEHLRQHYPPLS